MIENYRKTRKTHSRGTRAAQPAASDVLEGTLYFVTDEGVIEQSNGIIWQSYSGTGSSSSIASSPILIPSIDGEDGIDGFLGLRGTDGIAGNAGIQGLRGFSGLDGIDGENTEIILSNPTTTLRYRSQGVATGTQTISHNTNTPLNFGGTNYDIGAIHSNSVNNSRFTVPVAGLWLCNGAMYFTATSLAGTFSLGIGKNGAQVQIVIELPITVSSEATMSGSGVLELAAGDYIEFIGYQFSSALSTIAVQPTLTIGSVTLIQPL